MNFIFLDRIEKIIASATFLLLLSRMLTGYLSNGNPAQLIYIFDGLIVVVFLLIRRSTGNITDRLSDWIVGFAGTLLPLLVTPPDSAAAIAPAPFIALLMLSGIAVHLTAKLRLWRSFGVVAANRGVVDRGIYALVRHPMYLGYMIVHAGLLLAGPTPRNVALVLCTWLLLIFRISAEERILGADPSYRDFMSRTRFRLVPGIY